jgi:hypothetical protein
VELSIQNDGDDAVWLYDTDERLYYSQAEPYVEVGGDDERARAGFRFILPLPRGSTIESATLRLMRRLGDANANETMRVQVFDSATVPPFDDAHAHEPDEHDPGGLLALAIGGFSIGSGEGAITSPNLAALVQHVVDRSDYAVGGAIGFVLSADELARWAMFADRNSEAGTLLRIRYRAP